MPLLEIAISRPCSCFGNNRLTIRSQSGLHNKNLIGHERGSWLASTLSLKTLCFTEKLGKCYTLPRKLARRDKLTLNAVATLDIMSVSKKNEGVKGYQNVLRMDLDSDWSNPSDSKMESSNDDTTELDESEKLRRMKILKANKGNTPWNKGRKHSPETLQRIKERTRLAMQDPKVKMKLISLGHAQSEETRIKIGLGVRLSWERRHEKLMVQEACHRKWQNLIAFAAQRGLSGEEELQWDSYRTLTEELEKEWLKSVEQRKNTPTIKGSNRAPKSAEHKRKIAEAIAAKWADPAYRNRVCSGLAKYHCVPEVVERRSRRKPSRHELPRKRSPKKKDEAGVLAKRETKSPVERIRSKRRKALSYKDPLASSKLEMLKNIRAQRAASLDKKSLAITRARLLIVEAEKAAEALEISVKTNPLAEASLFESRMLIAEANQIIKSIEGQETSRFPNSNYLSENPTASVEADRNARDTIIGEHVKLNGAKSTFESLCSNDTVLPNHVKGKASKSFPCNIDETDGKQLLHMTSSNGHISLKSKDLGGAKADLNGISENLEAPEKQIKVTKKWVRGRLVEEEAEEES